MEPLSSGASPHAAASSVDLPVETAPVTAVICPSARESDIADSTSDISGPSTLPSALPSALDFGSPAATESPAESPLLTTCTSAGAGVTSPPLPLPPAPRLHFLGAAAAAGFPFGAGGTKSGFSGQPTLVSWSARTVVLPSSGRGSGCASGSFR